MPELRKRAKKQASDEKQIQEDNSSKKEKSLNQKIPLRVFSRIVIIFSLLIIVYFSSKNESNIKILARQNDYLRGVGQIIECSASYIKEVQKYEGCFPKECGRFVTDMSVSGHEAFELLNLAKKILSLGGSEGGAAIVDLHSGALSKGTHFVNLYSLKEAKGLITDKEFTLYRVVKEKIKYAIAQHFNIDPHKIYLTHPTFFSELTAKEAVTLHDEYWHPHVDKETYESFHYTSLLYLGDYGIDFKGGRFVFIDDKVNRTVEPRKARLSMFTSGAENLHYVEKVTSGTRYAMTISFTCDNKFAIEDPSINKFKKK